MKKIGILFGMEQTFPQELVSRINEMKIKDISAEEIKIGTVQMDDKLNYYVIFDRVSTEVPFYRSILKLAALQGVHVINNPFWSCADDSLFHSALAKKIGVKVPKTVILPSKYHPTGTNSETMRNLVYPLDWDAVFDYIRFPAYLKPNSINATYNEYKIYNSQEFFAAYDLTGETVMVLQENIDYEQYYRCYIVAKQNIKIMQYAPQKPLHLRYSKHPLEIDEKLKAKMEKLCLKICQSLGADFNAVEFAVKDGEPYVVNYMDPLPNAEKFVLHEENFEWLVQTTSKFLVEEAQQGKYLSKEYNWSTFLRGPKSPPKKKAAVKKKKK